MTGVCRLPYAWSLYSLIKNSLPTHWIYQPTNDKGKPRHYGPIPSHHTHTIQSITFNWQVYLANNTHDNSLYRTLYSTHWIYQPTNDKGKPRHYGPIPSHHTHTTQSITFNWRVYLGNNRHDNSLYRTLYSTHWQCRLTNDWVRSAVLADVCKTQSFHCKKEQNVQIISDITYISCGTDEEN